MSDCTSKYTIDRRTGQALACTGHHLTANWKRGEAHQASYSGVSFYWYDDEADK